MAFAIIVRPYNGDLGSEYELCRVGTNPEVVAAGARAKVVKCIDPYTGKKTFRPVYSHVEVKEV